MSETLTRRERREQQRRQQARRTGRTSTPSSPRRIRGIWIVLGAVALAAIAIFAAVQLGAVKAGPPAVDLNAAKYNVDQGEAIGTKLPDEGNSHLPTGQHATYNQNPPTSGSHWNSVAPPAPVAWGIKDTTQPNEAIVHNLEHGGLIVFWKGLDANDVDKLKDLVRLLSNNGFKKIVLEPYADMNDARIAVSAWDWQIKLPGYDDVQIVKFVKAHYDGPDAPERGVQ